MGENQFARLLKYYLMLNEKTQSDLSKDLGYAASTVSGWCSGARIPNPNKMIDIANYLHVDVGDLIVDDHKRSLDPSEFVIYGNDEVECRIEVIDRSPDLKLKKMLDVAQRLSVDNLDALTEIAKILKERE